MPKLSLRLDDDLHEKVQQCARAEQRSINWMLNDLVRSGLSRGRTVQLPNPRETAADQVEGEWYASPRPSSHAPEAK